MATISYRDKTKVSEDVEKLDHSLFAVGNENGISILETNLAVCLKGKHLLTLKLHSWTFIPEKWKPMFTQKPVCKYL